jgi:predicted lipoprotein with Yx(FWY)xxD motif
MLRLAVVPIVLAVIAVGCGDDEETPPAAATATATPAEPAADTAPTPRRRPARRGTRIKVVDSEFGRILANGRGQAVYLFDRETTRRSECYGDCAESWPPVLTKGRPVAGSGARARLLGTTRRRGGKRQVTYRGRPLYYYVDDAPGRVLCHNVEEFGGLWLVVRADGNPVS